jgi:hypothetical protein
MPDQKDCNGENLCRPSRPPHEYAPGVRPKDATDKEARAPRSRGRSVVVLYNEIRTHQGRWCFGKTPMQTFIDTLPLAKEKSLQPA